MLKNNNFTDVLILGGYKSHLIEKNISNSKDIGLNITFSNLDSSAETARRLYHAKDLLEDVFLLMYCDNYWPLNSEKMLKKFHSSKKMAQVTVYNNKF